MCEASFGFLHLTAVTEIHSPISSPSLCSIKILLWYFFLSILVSGRSSIEWFISHGALLLSKELPEDTAISSKGLGIGEPKTLLVVGALRGAQPSQIPSCNYLPVLQYKCISYQHIESAVIAMLYMMWKCKFASDSASCHGECLDFHRKDTVSFQKVSQVSLRKLLFLTSFN